jgi:hypothetical protein
VTSKRIAALAAAGLALAGGVTAAAMARSDSPAARVGLVSVFHDGAVFHTGQSLQYSALVFDSATRADLPAQSVTFDLLASGTTTRLPARAYKSYFWTGTAAVPEGSSGAARIRANVYAAGRHFSALSYRFTIRGPVKAVSLGQSSANGEYAVASVTGTIARPADGYVFASAETRPSQSVDMNWNVSCIRGTSASAHSGSATDGGPGTVTGDLVIKKIPMSMTNADSCTVSFSAQLSHSGTLKIEMLGNSWR